MQQPDTAPRYPLTRAFRLDSFEQKPVVALVGGGGKTTTMFSLASELAAQGRRVVTTTTTRLFASQRAESPAWCAVDELDRLSAILDEHGQCLVTAADGSWKDGKARGVDLTAVARLAARGDVDAVLIEADGSRSLPFKAPAEHEPVIPPTVTHVIALVGADIFGKPIDGSHVHRPERVCALAGVAEGSPVTPDVVARVLLDPAGGLKNVPDGAIWIPFLNKVENEADAMQADESARLLLGNERVREVIIGSLHRLREHELAESVRSVSSPPLSRRSRSAVVLLAAGMARRFGRTKQLLDWRGEALVARLAQVALEVSDTVLVVVGHEAEAVARAVDHLPVEVIYNEQFASGQGSSVAAGVSALLETSRPFVGEAFFMVSDQPFVTAALLQELRDLRALHLIAIPRHGEQRGNPVLFDHALFGALRRLSGDSGGRALFSAHALDIAWLDLADGESLRDVDTEEEWRSLAGDG